MTIENVKTNVDGKVLPASFKARQDTRMNSELGRHIPSSSFSLPTSSIWIQLTIASIEKQLQGCKELLARDIEAIELLKDIENRSYYCLHTLNIGETDNTLVFNLVKCTDLIKDYAYNNDVVSLQTARMIMDES